MMVPNSTFKGGERGEHIFGNKGRQGTLQDIGASHHCYAPKNYEKEGLEIILLYLQLLQIAKALKSKVKRIAQHLGGHLIGGFLSLMI